MTPPADLLQQFEAAFGRQAVIAASAPGRVNLIGEHLDYNGGLALPCAIDRRAWVLAAPLGDGQVQIQAADYGQSAVFDLADLEPAGASQMAGWARYPAGVAWSLLQAGHPLSGLQALVSSQVPIGAGLSSSAALEVAFASVWLGLAEVQVEPLALARLCQRAENDYVGVESGLLDQWTAIEARASQALLLDFSAMTSRPIRFPDDISLVVADSGVQRQLATVGYNQRVEQCRQALSLLRRKLPQLGSLSDLTGEQWPAVQPVLPPELARRVRHVFEENRRVEQAVAALQAGDSAEMGRLLIAGHQSLRDLYEVSHPQVDELVEMALASPGCFGARLTGAGFGGSTINWVERQRADAFADHLRRSADQRWGRQVDVWLCQPAQGASVMRLTG